MTVEETIKKIGERWFLTEPLLFAVYCSHQISENNFLKISMRTGNRRIEYSSKILSRFDEKAITEILKIEMYRILLKHPYQRQPPFASKELLAMASNVTIADVERVPEFMKAMMCGAELGLPQGLCFEEYYSLLKEMMAQNSSQAPNGESGESSEESEGNGNGNSERNDSEGSSGDGSYSGGGDFAGNVENGNSESSSKASQISELWEENEEASCDINGLIEIAMESNTWGSIPGAMKGLIQASLKVEMDYRRMLSLFKTSVISSRRSLTRMRPNRRFGFNAMGSRYKLSTNLLIAVDVSGSVTDKSLSFFFSVINRLFKYGVEKIDVIQFDTEIKSKPESFEKARKNIEIKGRGGTCFQPVADYYCAHPEYDGLVIFTDGYAPPPTYNTKRMIDVLWVLCGKYAYEENSSWIKKLKRNRVTFIPRAEQ